MKYIYPHLGLGDFVICNALIRELINDNEKYMIFTHKQNHESLKFMFRDLKNINFIVGYEDYATNDNFVYEYIRKYNLSQDDIIRITLNHSLKSDSFDENFYHSKSIDFNYRWTNFKCKRDLDREINLFKKFDVKENEYVFIHDDERRGFMTDINVIKNKELKIIKPIPNLTNNIFDYCYLMEKSYESHFIDSSFILIFDTYSLRNTNIYKHITTKNFMGGVINNYYKSKTKLNFIEIKNY